MHIIDQKGSRVKPTLLRTGTKFVLDSNVVIDFRNAARGHTQLTPQAISLLRETRRAVAIEWKTRHRAIPVDPCLAILELTKQSSEISIPSFRTSYLSFLDEVYNVKDVDPNWVDSLFEPLSKLTETVHHSLTRIVSKIIELSPGATKLSDHLILEKIDSFLNWLHEEKDDLHTIGGPTTYLAVYCIAGSPEASRFLKISKAISKGAAAVTENIAWDLMHCANLEMHHHATEYKSTVVCTQDSSLAEILKMRKNLGPRGKARRQDGAAIEAFGDLKLPKLARLENTSLSREVIIRLNRFWDSIIKATDDGIWLAPAEYLARTNTDPE